MGPATNNATIEGRLGNGVIKPWQKNINLLHGHYESGALILNKKIIP